jgi:hypothetical protein
MRLDSARSLKLEIAHDVFAPIVDGLLGNTLAPHIGPLHLMSPLLRIALGVARGNGPGDFHLAVRLQSRSSETQRFVDLVRERVRDELHVGFIGRVTAFADVPPTIADLRHACRPLVLGCSIAHIAGTAGTLGLIAKHRKTGRTVAVSCSHVLAQAGQAKLGDGITQPGRIDGGGGHVAALLDFVPLKTSGSNQIDAAVAVLDESIAIRPGMVPGVGAFTLRDTEVLVPGQKVKKLGRTTGLTQGEITVTELDDLVVDYDIGSVVFDDQIEITGLPNTPFSQPGDSGSLVIDEGMTAIGMVFSGNPFATDGAGVSYANPLPKVIAGLDIDKSP